MIEVLDSLKLKLNQDLTDVGVTATGNTYPDYTEQNVDGRIEYTKTFRPEYVANGALYSVQGLEEVQATIREYINLKSSYDPLDLQIDYLNTTVYDQLTEFDISFFKYWYFQATKYSQTAVYAEVSAKDLYREFGNSVGAIMLYTPTPETTPPTTLNSANVKVYDRVIETNILDDIRTELDQAAKDVNSSYSTNIANVASGSSSTTAHGGKLVVDTSNNTRYQSVSSTYISTLFSAYAQLMYLTPVYAYSTQDIAFTVVPYFTGTVEGVSVLVDNQNTKVSTTESWLETAMLSAYPEA